MASIMKRGDSYSVRYTYKDHSGKPCEGWGEFQDQEGGAGAKDHGRERTAGRHVPCSRHHNGRGMLYKWIPIQSTKHKWSPKTYTQSVAMVQNLIVPYIGNRKVQELRTYDIEKVLCYPCQDPLRAVCARCETEAFRQAKEAAAV